ncbi:MAG: hypothetical protein AAF709_14250 [Pseudomonadota bacterium]
MFILRFLFASVGGVVIGLVLAANVPTAAKLHTWVKPCSVSKWIGRRKPTSLGGPRFTLGWQVVDGDTIRCEGLRVRLADIDAPDPKSPHGACYRKRMLADIATAYLDERMRTASWHLSRDRHDGLQSYDLHGRAKVSITFLTGSPKLTVSALFQNYRRNGFDWCDLRKVTNWKLGLTAKNRENHREKLKVFRQIAD